MLLKKARLTDAVGATQYTKRPVSDVRKHSFSNRCVILGELLLSHSAFLIQNLVGTCNREGGWLFGSNLLRAALFRAGLFGSSFFGAVTDGITAGRFLLRLGCCERGHDAGC